jgi:hypothetical protein
MLSVITLNVVMLNVVMVNFVVLNVIMLSVVLMRLVYSIPGKAFKENSITIICLNGAHFQRSTINVASYTNHRISANSCHYRSLQKDVNGT